MLPVEIIKVCDFSVVGLISYYWGLVVRQEVCAEGVRFAAFKVGAVHDWIKETEDHHIEIFGGLHGRGRIFGCDSKTKEIRSLWHDMKALDYTVEDDE
jgi:hypothetical protein